MLFAGKRARTHSQQQASQRQAVLSLTVLSTTVVFAASAQASEVASPAVSVDLSPSPTLLQSSLTTPTLAEPAEATLPIPFVLPTDVEKPNPTSKPLSQLVPADFEQHRLAEAQATVPVPAVVYSPDRFARLRARLFAESSEISSSLPIPNEISSAMSVRSDYPDEFMPDVADISEPAIATHSTLTDLSRVEPFIPPASGVYLYGQQPVADQPGVAYFVFESQGADVVGAFFMPASSFDCVQGQITHRQMTLTVKDSYSQATHAHTLPLNSPQINIASEAGAISMPPNIADFHPLPVRPQDRRLLATCQSI